MARHPLALRAIVVARGAVDPTALVLRVRGLGALRDLPRALRLLVRGKINPIKTLLRWRSPASAAARRLLGRGRA
jgi:succinate dehydrogenase / fumarate reductase iron-sulfur subunit